MKHVLSFGTGLVLVACWVALVTQLWQPSPVAASAHYVFIRHFKFG